MNKKALTDTIDGNGAKQDPWPAPSSLRRNGRGVAYPKDFELVWDAYPKTGNKLSSYKHVRSSVQKGATVEQIVKGIDAYLKANTESKYHHAAHNFFGNEHWDAPEPKKGRRPSGGPLGQGVML